MSLSGLKTAPSAEISRETIGGTVQDDNLPGCVTPNVTPNNVFPATLPIAPDKPWLAPLAGYSDLPFRLLCREQGAAVAVTEMVSAKGLFYNSKASMALLATYPDFRTATARERGTDSWCFPLESVLGGDNLSVPDAPLVVQLFGAEADYLGRAVAFLREQGYGWFDCNMGCSVPKVVKSGAGAALLKDQPNALKVAKAMLDEAGPGRVGFKIRLGWELGSESYLSLALALEELGAGWITLHPRAARQGFSGRADWQSLARLKKMLKIPLMASGDLMSAEAGKACLDQTGVDGLMFARGAMQDPGIFRKLLALLADAEADEETGAVKAMILRHAFLARNFTPAIDSGLASRTALLKMRTFVPRYVRNFSGVRELRLKLTQLSSWQELEDLLQTL